MRAYGNARCALVDRAKSVIRSFDGGPQVGRKNARQAVANSKLPFGDRKTA